MMSRHFALNSELSGAIAKDQLSAPGSFFIQFVKPTIHDATLLHANVACNKVASCMSSIACNLCMEIEHVLFSCNILHQNCINFYNNDNDNHYQKYDQAIKIDNRKSACFS